MKPDVSAGAAKEPLDHLKIPSGESYAAAALNLDSFCSEVSPRKPYWLQPSYPLDVCHWPMPRALITSRTTDLIRALAA